MSLFVLWPARLLCALAAADEDQIRVLHESGVLLHGMLQDMADKVG